MPTKLRTVGNKILKDYLKDKEYRAVLSIGGKKDGDSEGGRYSDYFNTNKFIRVNSESIYKDSSDIIADYDNIPIKSNSVNLVFFNGVLSAHGDSHDIDMEKCLKEVVRVLSDDGEVVIPYSSYSDDSEGVIKRHRDIILKYFEQTKVHRYRTKEDRYLNKIVNWDAEVFFGKLPTKAVGGLTEDLLSTVFDTSKWEYHESLFYKEIYSVVSCAFEKMGCKNILDIGCWNSALAEHIDFSDAEKYIGADLCSEILEKTRVKISNGSWGEPGIESKIDLIKYDWKNDSIVEVFQDYIGIVDGIYIGGSLFYIKNSLRYIESIMRVFRPKMIIIQDLDITDLSSIILKYYPKQELYRMADFNIPEAGCEPKYFRKRLEQDAGLRKLLYITHSGCDLSPDQLSFVKASDNERWKYAVRCPVCNLLDGDG